MAGLRICWVGDPPGCPGEPIGRVDRGLLVAGEDVVDGVFDHCVVRRHDRAARITEADLDPLAYERLPDDARSGKRFADAILQLGIGGCHEGLLRCWLAGSTGFDAAFKRREANEKGAWPMGDRAPSKRAHDGMLAACQHLVFLRCGCLFMGSGQQKSPRTFDAGARN